MSYPSKFRALLETTLDDVETPASLWLVYAVCAVTDDACGWSGWIIDGAFKNGAETYGSLLPADYEQKCPRCGLPTFRTEAAVHFVPSSNQEPRLKPGVDYDVSPMEWH